MSKVIEILMNEHKEIVKFIGNLRIMCLDFINHNKIDINEFRKSIHFIKTYADERHHQKEEQILFQSMVEHLGVRAENIIKYGMLIEHDLARYHVNSLDEAVSKYEKDASDENKLNILTHALSYCDLLLRHAYKEDNVAYPFGEKNLPKEELARLDILAEEYEKRYK